MKILAIGNSFSEDATRYLYDIAKADGCKLKVVNLYIGGCPLRAHYINCIEDKKAYELQFNGMHTGFMTSIKDALISDDWDIITLQQVSHFSVNYETYQPYLDFLVEYVKKYSPKSKIYIHQTWAYEQGSYRLEEELGYRDYRDMLKDIKNAYKKAADRIDADAVIPSGELFDLMLDHGIKKVHRDTFHASLGLGRYALALLWYRVLCKADVLDNAFCEFDEEIKKEDIVLVKEIISKNF